MAWDDSDDSEEEDLDFEKQIAEKKKAAERQRRLDEGLSSESEEEAAPKPAAAAPKPKSKPAPKGKKSKEESESEDEEEKPMTAEERKLLQRKREEEMSARVAEDLFAGCDMAEEAKETAEKKRKEAEKKKELAANKPTIVYIDSFDSLELKVQKDVDSLITTCTEKLTKGTAKAGASIFCVNILKQLESSLSFEELEAVQRAIAELMKVKQGQKAETQTIEKKANTKINKNTKFNTNSEWEDIYGGGGDDEEWTKEEWDAWTASQAGGGEGAAPAAAKGAKW